MHAKTPEAIVRIQIAGYDAGLSIETMRRRSKAGTFPPIVRTSTRSSGVRRGELDRWLADPMAYRAPAEDDAAGTTSTTE
ncbi:transcriptional regulator, AlpA family [Burkholderia sp. D7]|nr:transcriptional regulator, AlpA family [Burkholderia sp. D7]